MIKIYLLTAWMGTGFFYLPFPTPVACITAMKLLDYRVARDATCTEVEVIVESNIYAPEMSPVPRARPRVFRTTKWSLL